MAIKNKSIVREWRSQFIAAKEFNSVANLALVLGEAAPNTITSNNIGSLTSSAGPLISEINSLDLAGLEMDTAGEVVRTLFPIPHEWDVSQDIHVRVHWTSGSATAADTITFKAFYEPITLDTTALTATINNALDTAIPEDTVGTTTAYVWRRTAPGKINANTLTADTALLWEIEMDAKAGGLSEAIFFLGLEILYVPMVSNDKSSTGPVAPLPTAWA